MSFRIVQMIGDSFLGRVVRFVHKVYFFAHFLGHQD